jgi:hypothetical protein
MPITSVCVFILTVMNLMENAGGHLFAEEEALLMLQNNT